MDLSLLKEREFYIMWKDNSLSRRDAWVHATYEGDKPIKTDGQFLQALQLLSVRNLQGNLKLRIFGAAAMEPFCKSPLKRFFLPYNRPSTLVSLRLVTLPIDHSSLLQLFKAFSLNHSLKDLANIGRRLSLSELIFCNQCSKSRRYPLETLDLDLDYKRFGVDNDKFAYIWGEIAERNEVRNTMHVAFPARKAAFERHLLTKYLKRRGNLKLTAGFGKFSSIPVDFRQELLHNEELLLMLK